MTDTKSHDSGYYYRDPDDYKDERPFDFGETLEKLGELWDHSKGLVISIVVAALIISIGGKYLDYGLKHPPKPIQTTQH